MPQVEKTNDYSIRGGVLRIFIGVVLAIVLIILAVYLVSLVRNSMRQFDYIGKSPDYKNIVNVEGVGRVTVKPDIASVNIGIVTEGATVTAVQKQNVEKMNSIIREFKSEFKIEDKDIRTSNYSISPKYDWSQKVQRIVGYSINQSVTVKIRNFDQIGNILAKASTLGANSVSGPQFTIDDPEIYKAQAREEAVSQAKEKAKVLASQVGINLGRIVNFYESGAGYPIPVYDTAFNDMARLEKSMGASPDIQAGSDEVVVSVSISYEIK